MGVAQSVERDVGDRQRLHELGNGGEAASGGPGGGDLATWLRAIDPKIYFFLGFE